MDLDEDDPSGDWVLSQSVNGTVYTPNGPLGSDRSPGPNGIGSGGGGGGGGAVTPNGAPPQPQGINITKKKGGRDPGASPPLTNSVQENFRGFTYSGENESVIASAVGRLAMDEPEEEQAVDEEGVEPTTDDEAEDDASCAGRYARRKGYLDDDMDV